MPADVEGLCQIVAEAGRLLIMTHDNPDPDALAGTCALARLVETRTQAKTRICCDGIVGRAENQALVRALHMKLVPASRIKWKSWPAIALVDAQPWTGNNSFPQRVTPTIVIDHHPLRRRTRGKYIDIRPEYGATASIVAEYLLESRVSIPPNLAAALCYAILSETQDLGGQANEADMRAYVQLYPLSDRKIFSRIRHPRLKHSYYATLARGVISAFTYGNIIGTHVGPVHHPDSISLLANLLLRHERMGWSIVTGIYKDTLHVSLRTNHHRVRSGMLLARVIGPKGRAGGHDTMAGGQVPLTDLSDDERKKLPDEIAFRLVHLLKKRNDVAFKGLLDVEELAGSCKVER